MSKTASEYLVEALEKVGVKRVYGVVGDSLNGFTDAMRRRNSIDWIHMRHEEAAAFAAGAEAHLTGNLAVCAGSCGPGNLHLINGLFDCQRNGVPVLAIAAHIPSSEIGIDYFQATHPESLFRDCSHYVELVSVLPQILKRAIRVAIAKRGVAVVVLPGDVALMKIDADVPEWIAPTAPVLRPGKADVEHLAGFLNAASRVRLFCGAGCAGAHAEVIELARKLKAPIVHAFRGKRVHRIRQSLRRGDDRSRRLCVRLRGNEELRRSPDARYGFSIPGLLPGACEDRASRCAAGGAGQSLLASFRPARHRQGHFGCRAAGDQGEDGFESSERCSDRLQEGAQRPRRFGRERLQQQSHSSPICDAPDQRIGGRRRDLHLRCGNADHLDGALSEGQRQAAHHRLVQSRIDGECDAAGNWRAGDVSGSTGHLDVGRRRVQHDDGRLFHADPDGTAGEGHRPQQWRARLCRNGDEGERIPRHRLRTQEPQFALMADAVGVRGIRVEKPQELKAAITAALAHKGPVLVDVVSARQELAMPPKTTLDQAYHFGMYMMKAVLDGRATQLVDLAKVNLSR